MKTAEELQALQDAARELDDLWEFEANRGRRDSVGSAEYERISPAPILRAIADEMTVREVQGK